MFESEEAWLERCQEAFMKLKLDTEDFLKERTISQKKDYWTGSNKKAKQEALLTSKKVQLTIQAPGRQH